MKAAVLLSGGIDSTTCLALACSEHGTNNVSALFAYYGQKHAKEYESAKKVAEFYKVPLYVVDLSNLYAFSKCSLLAHSDVAIKHTSYAEQLKEEKVVNTYVPFRNGLFLSAVSAMAMSLYPDQKVCVYYGAHMDDAAGGAYPDCTRKFKRAMAKAIKEGTAGMCELRAPLIGLNKAGVVRIGHSLGAPYLYTWSCYEGGDVHCGTCGTCIDRKKAFQQNGITDPTEYKE